MTEMMTASLIEKAVYSPRHGRVVREYKVEIDRGTPFNRGVAIEQRSGGTHTSTKNRRSAIALHRQVCEDLDAGVNPLSRVYFRVDRGWGSEDGEVWEAMVEKRSRRDLLLSLLTQAGIPHQVVGDVVEYDRTWVVNWDLWQMNGGWWTATLTFSDGSVRELVPVEGRSSWRRQEDLGWARVNLVSTLNAAFPQ